MKASTITERLHAKADADLKAKLKDSVEWVWKQTGHTCTRPKLEDFPEVAMDGKMPWIGHVSQLFESVAFAYLRDQWRDRYVSEFMAKVETMASEMESLGIAVQAQLEE